MTQIFSVNLFHVFSSSSIGIFTQWENVICSNTALLFYLFLQRGQRSATEQQPQSWDCLAQGHFSSVRVWTTMISVNMRPPFLPDKHSEIYRGICWINRLYRTEEIYRRAGFSLSEWKNAAGLQRSGHWVSSKIIPARRKKLNSYFQYCDYGMNCKS